MRDDPKMGEAFKKNANFEVTTRKAAVELQSDYWGKNSLSGHERNRLFISKKGKSFGEVSLISGSDHLGDGRSVVLFDYDRDGKTDIASINTNAPKLVLYKNEVTSPHHFAAFRFVGAGHSAEGSNRDGIGVRVELALDRMTVVEELRAGEGFSAQNSKTLLIGLGESKVIPKAKFYWPSGKTSEFENLPVNRLITITEGKTEYTIEAYRP